MSRRATAQVIPIPRLPRPTGEVTQIYIDQLVSAIEALTDVLSSEQPRRFAELSLSDLQGHGDGLRIDEIFQDSGILKIVRSEDRFAGSFVSTTAIGTVTVSTS